MVSVIVNLFKSGKGSVVILPNHRIVRDVYSNLFELGIESTILSDLNLLPFESAESIKDELASRVEALHDITDGKIVIADVMAILKKTAPKDFIKDGLNFSLGSKMPSNISEILFNLGYTKVLTVRSVGEFATRGDIIDIFSPVQKAVRIETFDQDVESIRIFDPQTQLSVKNADSVMIYPACEIKNDEESLSLAQKRLEGHPDLLENVRNLYGLTGIFWKNSQCGLDFIPDDEYTIVYEINECQKYVEEYEKEIMDLYDPNLLSLFRSFAYSAFDRIDHKKIIHVTHQPLKKPLDNVVELKSGMVSPNIVPSKKEANFYDYIQEIEIGAPVVHEDHGIGIYRGTEIIKDTDGIREYLKIEYRNGSILYTPIEKFSKVRKYVGSPDVTLSDINGKEWKRIKDQAQSDIEAEVKDLVKLYAVRENSNGFAFMPQRELEEAFAKSFGYLETPDQMKAIEDVFEDMESIRPMDRLVCGDAGFGKTEVALRAAFRAVANGKQVALLAPTLILARQHYETFKKRMEPFGINVALIYSQTTQSQKRYFLDSIAKGKTDVVIGTHSLLSGMLSFKDIGLLIIDEEQRFGTKQKEFLKSLKTSMDVLTLSATPIPRTLHMALSGIRAISVINTPPLGRIPPRIFITKWNEKIVTMAILKEINRGGQVFYLHNRIEDIETVIDKLRSILPSVVIGELHGRMPKREFEETVNGFYKGKIDVLVSTSVIENGVDIPNANTLIVDDVERYGMAQLYQIKGRVGRSERKAYIYFMYTKEPSEMVMKRLSAIDEFNELGSSMNLALKDMEIRGVGEVLGLKQHGHVDAIGLEMYREILDNTIKKMRGEKIEEKFCDSDISLPSAILPEGYVQDTMERMKIYRRLANVKSVEEVEDIKKEIIDRFGKIPESSENLFVHSEIRVLICDLKIVKVSYQNGNVELVFRDKETLADFSKFKKFHSVNLQKNVMILSDVVKDGNLKALLKLLLEYKKHADQKEGVA